MFLFYCIKIQILHHWVKLQFHGNQRPLIFNYINHNNYKQSYDIFCFQLFQETWICESLLLYQNIGMEFKTFHACEIAYIYLLIYARWDGKGWRWWKSWVILHGKSSILNPRQFLIFYDAKIGRCWKTYVQTENPHSMLRDRYRSRIYPIVSICRYALRYNIFMLFHLSLGLKG